MNSEVEVFPHVPLVDIPHLPLVDIIHPKMEVPHLPLVDVIHPEVEVSHLPLVDVIHPKVEVAPEPWVAGVGSDEEVVLVLRHEVHSTQVACGHPLQLLNMDIEHIYTGCSKPFRKSKNSKKYTKFQKNMKIFIDSASL